MLIKPDNAIEIEGKLYNTVQCNYYDENGNKLKNLLWIDTDAQTFGQFVKDEQGLLQIDPSDPDKPLAITRYGKVSIVPKELDR